MEATDKLAASRAQQGRLVATVVWAYSFLLHGILAAVLYYLYPGVAPALLAAPLDAMALVCYGMAVMAMGAAVVVPPMLQRTRAGPFASVISRCALIETAAFAGFALALLRQSPALFLPFLALGLPALIATKLVGKAQLL